MKCPLCGAPTDVKDSRVKKPNKVVRKRECFNGHLFKTEEIVVVEKKGTP
jgi:transcriptional regulator NrdR family protein